MDVVLVDSDIAKNPQEVADKPESKPTLFSEVLTSEQQSLIQTERDIGNIVLSDDGELLTTRGTIETDERTKGWTKKKGVLSAGIVNNTLVVVYNANNAIPEGLPDVKEKGRAGEFNPRTMMTYTDVSGTYSYLDERYKPSWVQQNVRHELRHALVAQQDETYSKKVGGRKRRFMDKDVIRASNPEELYQLACLDELHSHFLDVVEGDLEGHTFFRKLDSDFYSTEVEGSYLEVASSTSEGKAEATKVFYKLQGIILLQRMSEAGHIEGI